MQSNHRHNPTRPIFAAPLFALAALAGISAWFAPGIYRNLVAPHPQLAQTFAAAGGGGLITALAIVLWICAGVFLIGGAAALYRRPIGLKLTRAALWFVYLGALFHAYAVLRLTGEIVANDVKIDEVVPDSIEIFMWRWRLIWPAFLASLGAAVVHVLSWRRSTIDFYAGEDAPQAVAPEGEVEAAPAPGDRILENVRTHGRDPQYRKSMLTSAAAHVLVVLVIPWLLDMVGCVENYRVPFGSGQPTVTMVRFVQKKKKQKEYILRPDSAIYFDVPELEESKILEEVKEMTEQIYAANPNAVAGKMGAGGGTEGGWPEGMKDGKVRFVVLEYSGAGWNDGLNDAFPNFLAEFKKITGFPTARRAESHPIGYLTKYDKGYAPPFVYMTGDGGIRLSSSEVKTLREYLLDGGMLFADAGSPSWDNHFRSLMNVLFPGEPLLTIADDDPIFQMPYAFPNGAPPLWHHGGSRALGIKRKGRWVVFYHPGDVNDAWKTGHSGMDRRLADQSMQLGINIIYYAFTRYLEETKRYRK